MSSGVIQDAVVLVGQYSQYSVGRPWASGREGITGPVVYGFLGWREDAGEGQGAGQNLPAFPTLDTVCTQVIECASRGGWPDRREATIAFLRRHPYAEPTADGLDWSMGVRRCALAVLGTERAADGLLLQPTFRSAWEAAVESGFRTGAEKLEHACGREARE
jgi:hypothetical protein